MVIVLGKKLFGKIFIFPFIIIAKIRICAIILLCPTDAHIENCMYTINDVIMINPELITDLIEIEISKIEIELKCCEDYTKTLMMYSTYMKKILPDNIPEDLTNIIFGKL